MKLPTDIRIKSFVLSILCSALALSWSNQVSAQSFYTENLGQWNSQVCFLKNVRGATIYLKDSAISVLQYDDKTWASMIRHPHEEKRKLFKSKKPTSLQFHHFEIDFPGATFTSKPEGLSPADYRINYFLGNDQSKWTSNVKDYGTVIYRSIYPNIDLILHGDAGGLKYDFIIHPGGSLSDIAIRYNHVNGLQVFDDSLVIQTALGSFSEQVTRSYQVYNGELELIDINFEQRTDGNIGLVTDNRLNSAVDLIIDPELVFATYAGNSADNFGFTATYDTAGNLYAGGNVTSPNMSFNPNGRYPATVGAFDVTFNGGDGTPTTGFPCDIALSKYSSDGSTLLYATYLGGNRDEQPHSIIVDEQGELIVFGTSRSSNYPTTIGAAQPFNKGDYDIVVSKFNADCSALIGSTFVGGSATDGLNSESTLKFYFADDFRGEVQLDDQGNILISSSTFSTDFPTVNAFQTSNAGRQDGVFVMLSKDLRNVLWSTYLGGSDGDALYSVDIDNRGLFYLSGGTKSSNLPQATGKIGTRAPGGLSDGYVAILDPSNKSLVKTAYWGTNSYDQIFHLEIDRDNKVYVVGQTSGKMPIEGQVYNNPESGQFISQFDQNLDKVEFSTVFGTGRRVPDITINAFLVDECGKIFVSGWGGENSFKISSTTDGLPVTSDAYQSTTDGSDFYLMVLSKQAKRLAYATFFGGTQTADHVDGGTSRFDKKGVIYQSVCASCPPDGINAISDFPTTSGAYAEKNVSPRCSNAAFKIAFGNLNRKPRLEDKIYSFRALDTFGFTYTIYDPDEDSLFVDLTPETSLLPNMVTYSAKSSALTNWQQSISLTAGCDQIGDTLEVDVYVIDKGCPGVLDSTATLRFVILPPPVLDPPETICLNFVGDDAVRLEWESMSYSKYFDFVSLYKINPSGDTVLLNSYKSYQGDSYLDEGLSSPKLTNYEYFLVVTNKCGADGPQSYRVSTTKEYQFPINSTYLITATVQDGETFLDSQYVKVAWARSDEEDFGYYDIYRKKNDDKSSFEYYASTYDVNDTFFIDKKVQVDKQSYCYALVVNDNCGHRSKQSNIGCTIVIEGVSEPFEHRLYWNNYKDWAEGVNNYELYRCVDTGYLRPIVTTNFDNRYYKDTSFDYCWGGYWYRVRAYENPGEFNAISESNRIYLIQPPLLYVPNAFTPNGDNLNELWGIVPVFVKTYHVEVYDRWGEKVYDSNDVKTDWDGYYRGKQYPNNVYIYKITYTGWDRSIHHRKGTVTVIK